MTMCIIEINEIDNIRAIGRPRLGSNDETTNTDERRILRRYSFQFAAPTMIGTKVRNNKRLILVDIDGDVDEFMESVTSDETGEDGRPAKKNLRWRLIAREGERITGQGQLINYFDDVPVFDVDPQTGDPIIVSTRRPTLAEVLPAWAGKQWIL